MITGMERLQAAIKGEKSDRIPIFCTLLEQGAKEMGMSLDTYYSRGEYVAEAQLKLREKYGYDNLWSLFYVGREAELLGCEKILFAKDGPPNVAHFVIQDWKDIPKLQIPDDLNSHPLFEEQSKCLKLLRKEAGGKYPICAYLSSPMTLPALLMGMEKWFELLFLGPLELRNELLEYCHTFFVKEVETYRKLGVDLFLYSNPFGSLDMVPLKFFKEHALPWIEKDLEAAGKAGIIYYCGMSRLNRVLEMVIEKTGCESYYLSPLDDLAEGKRLIAQRGLTCGVINDMKLKEWSATEIRNEVQRLIQIGMPGGKFLFGTGLIPMDTPEEKIRLLLETAYEFGRYQEAP
ncbi:uroporphyrinogen decarboxylase [bacterium (Candidatus Blackallbacteria) CG17_big_fil_post_rev_8_21_14_2_50_48_46]|uniref:Uroporphyrinogen decarboxylase n=1 Tax=bacterium (Candidatus Blackallbacteria) CG17_big_fil_post_rev_8_21_14_2_50_48_46 TaxID=2014261 RepID=A0A2M7G9Q7_9BACT|nr:MAG: uroporphyrinogen decarboxylase [bacterium (Candidatus Blackallbacteria) CG18_big_fil_WC_8_21_14_2_50_49_26]PIW18862.1 MAG: uroporphyrinogen decarboxylase [bacterium (Candidatus Blackallbacteria) CG17_big_fil_post_rev_8_21_14_2_50_48_46]PIW44853.1 MAG: uroporphyrinogen decarboxylase [bacterium (Candidatus Blackallbacteria) CG13_big_fil_rev_8_21_14_2_50_49_14]